MQAKLVALTGGGVGGAGGGGAGGAAAACHPLFCVRFSCVDGMPMDGFSDFQIIIALFLYSMYWLAMIYDGAERKNESKK